MQPGSAVEGYENAHVSGALLGNSCDFGLIIISTGAGDAKVLWLGIAELPWLTTVHLSQYSSIPLDDKNCLVVYTIFLANLSQTIISFDSVFEQCPAYVSCRQQVVLAHDVFKLLSFLLIAAVINAVGVKEENVPRTHQR